MQLAKNPVYQDRSKHIKVCFHYLCEQVAQDSIQKVPIRTDYNITDIFTKALGCVKFNVFSKHLVVDDNKAVDAKGHKD